MEVRDREDSSNGITSGMDTSRHDSVVSIDGLLSASVSDGDFSNTFELIPLGNQRESTIFKVTSV